MRPGSNSIDVHRPGKAAAPTAVPPSPSIDVTEADQGQIDAENRRLVESLTAAEVQTCCGNWLVSNQLCLCSPFLPALLYCQTMLQFPGKYHEIQSVSCFAV